MTDFRNSYNPRIAVTVDMIATGTDIKPVEVVFFMRNVRSRSFFEQMKGRGVRVISSTDFNAVTPDAKNKERFVIVDAVGVTESDLSDSYSLDRKPTVSFDRLLDLVGAGNREPEALSSLASRLTRLDRKLTSNDRKVIEDAAGGVPPFRNSSPAWSTPQTRTPPSRGPNRPPDRMSHRNRPSTRRENNCWRMRRNPWPPIPSCVNCWRTSAAPMNRPSTT